MILYRILQRFLVLVIWLVLMSLLGFTVAVVNHTGVTSSLIAFNLTNYLKFLDSVFTGSFFFYESLHTLTVIKLLITTFELVVVSTCFALVFSLVLTSFTIRRVRLFNYLMLIFSILRVVPFITLPLLLNQVIGNSVNQTLQILDDTSSDFASASRLWVIVTGQTDHTTKLLFNFLGLGATASYFIVPAMFVVIAKVTRQITSYSYVSTLNESWTPFQIMRKMVMHRLIPVLLKEMPVIIVTFFMFVAILEYLFSWSGIGSLLFLLLSQKERFASELGLFIFVIGSFFILLQYFFILARSLYDLHQRKELPYETD